MYLLDTDTCVWILRMREPVVARVREQAPDDLAISSMTEAELRFGMLKGSSALNVASTEDFLSEIGCVLPFDSAAAKHHAEIRYSLRGTPISERDMVIAATASSRRCTVVTGNVREFSRVPGLNVMSWI